MAILQSSHTLASLPFPPSVKSLEMPLHMPTYDAAIHSLTDELYPSA